MGIARYVALGSLLLACQGREEVTASTSDEGRPGPSPTSGEQPDAEVASPAPGAEATDGDAIDAVPLNPVSPSTGDAPQGRDDASAPSPSAELRDGSSGSTPADEGPSAMEVCQEYFETICSRIRQCGAPTYRPCESPPDLCPDVLFASGSTWTTEEVLDCTETWKSHDCQMLANDIWPSCSEKHGTRPDESSCVFDAQCASGGCVGGIVPLYDAACGTCKAPVSAGGTCNRDNPCARGLNCDDETCVALDLTLPLCEAGCPDGQECRGGTCFDPPTEPLPRGALCTERTPCADGLGCQIEIAEGEDEEPLSGICEPLPPVGEPCLPSFVSLGLCAEGGTCNSRPTGDCVPLGNVGDSCGFTACVDGAHCQVFGDVVDDVPSHTCYANRGPGEECFGYNEMCATGTRCLCEDDACASERCTPLLQEGEACGGPREVCAPPLRCRDGACTAVVTDEPPEIAAVLGLPCNRFGDYGRKLGDCPDVSTEIECLCVDATCAMPICARPSVAGESCDGETELCRQGFSCENARCVALELQGLEALNCTL